MSEIVVEGSPVLARSALEVPPEKIISIEIRRIIERMRGALAQEPLGVAIAAPQIGESLRIFVVSGRTLALRNGANERLEPDRVYINPEILKTSRKKQEMHEGCLSVRSKTLDTMVWGTVMRAQKMKIRAYDEKGKKNEHSATGFLAQIFQHEIDHLEGILYTAKATRIYEEKIPKTE